MQGILRQCLISETLMELRQGDRKFVNTQQPTLEIEIPRDECISTIIHLTNNRLYFQMLEEPIC
jgi:hypothetical protein